MPAIEIATNIFWVGVNDRTTDLFEGVWPIAAEGVSYNAYVIRDEKTALIDLTRGFKTDEYLGLVQQLVPPASIDYIIVNHSEPDHTGALPAMRKLAPQAQILCTPKAADMILNFYGISDNVRIVKNGETLSLGRRTLKFCHTPFLHWPDTMMTISLEDRILFSCDAFGGYGALPGNIFDDGCGDLEGYRRSALRYYATIISKYSHLVVRALDQIAALNIPLQMVAPAHGLIWRRSPSTPFEWYRTWADWHAGKAEPGVTLLFGSMYGNTEKYMNGFAQGIAREGLPVEIFDVAKIHSAYILPSVMRYQAVALNVPTYESGLFPPAAHALDMIGRKNIRHRSVAIFGSYLWSGGAHQEFKTFIESMEWKLINAHEFRGASGRTDPGDALEFGRSFAAALKNPAPTSETAAAVPS